MATSGLQNAIEKYGPSAGPKMYHALQSRAAYIGANSRRRRTIADLTGIPVPKKWEAQPARDSTRTPLLLEAEAK